MTTGSCSQDARKYVIIEELRRAGTFDAILSPQARPKHRRALGLHQTKCKPGGEVGLSVVNGRRKARVTAS